MKRNIFIFFVALYSTLFIGIVNTMAKECSYGLQAPEIPQPYNTNKGHTVVLKTSASACKGINTEVWFSKFGTLPSWYVPSNGTIIHADLMEDDPPGNDDELVKYYIGYFSGRTLVDFKLSKIFIEGNIDSEGDQTCELYMNFMISGTQNGKPIPQGLFYYDICMK